jgi:hypothetical protein
LFIIYIENILTFSACFLGRSKKKQIPSKGSREAVVRASHGKPKKTQSPAVCSSCGTNGHHYAPTCRGVKQGCGENQL